MAWERGKYYTRSRWVNGRVVRDYVGAGPIGRLVADMDAASHEDRKAKATEFIESRIEAEGHDEKLRALERMAEVLTRAALVAAGCRQHHRGEWRRQREPN
jgi:hypothetical protein